MKTVSCPSFSQHSTTNQTLAEIKKRFAGKRKANPITVEQAKMTINDVNDDNDVHHEHNHNHNQNNKNNENNTEIKRQRILDDIQINAEKSNNDDMLNPTKLTDVFVKIKL